jgi:transposase-like protein
MASKNLVEAKLAQLREGQWSEADARVVLAAVERSGASVLAFARAHDLSAKRIYSWRARLSDRSQRDGELEQLSFAPVVVTGLGRTPAVVVRIGDIEIDVLEPENVEPTWLAQVLAAAKRGA